MSTFNVAIALISFAIIVLGLLYRRLQRGLFNETLLAMLTGIALGPAGLGVLDMRDWGIPSGIMDKACRLTLAMALMATALRLPEGYLKGHFRTQATLLLLVMPAMFLASALIFRLVLGLAWLPALLAGAVITPTDPVLAGAIVTGDLAEQNLPGRLRHAISFESGANDGLAFPLVSLCLLLQSGAPDLWSTWLRGAILWETGGAVLAGLALGWGAGRLLEACIHSGATGKPAVLAFALSVAFFMLTGLELAGVNGILAVFAGGLMLKRTLGKSEDIEEIGIQDMMARLFTIPIFIFFGLIIPWTQWFALGWPALIAVFFVLVFRRLPFLVLGRPLLRDFTLRDSVFAGWFGPIGAAALFYSFYTYGDVQLEIIWTITSLMVFSSVIVHGLTASWLVRLYGKRKASPHSPPSA